MKMQIVRLFKIDDEKSKIAAFVDLGIEDKLLVKGFKVMRGKKGLYVGYPTKEGRDEKHYETIVAMDNLTKQDIENAIIKGYSEFTG